MLTFPLWYLLLPLAVVGFATTIFLFFNVYHIAKFGVQSMSTVIVAVGYVVSYLVIAAVVGVTLSQFDWTAQVALTDIIPLSSESNNRFGL